MKGTGFVGLALSVLLPVVLTAQLPPPLPPEVGNAVLLGTRYVQVDRDTVVHTGDLVVNDAAPVLFPGELELSIDQGVTTPAGYALKANGVDIDRKAVAGGNVHYNVLQNDGTIAGTLITPLQLPVIGMLPQLPNRPAGTEDIVVADGAQRILGRGDYAALSVGQDATLRLPGGPYTFTSITVARGGRIVWDGPGDAIVHGRMVLGADAAITAAPGVNTKRKMFFVHAADAFDASGQPLYAVSIGSGNAIGATVHAPNGSVVAGQGLTLLGSIVARDIRIGRDGSLTLRSGFRNLPPVAVNQNVAVQTDAVTITLSGFDPDSDPLVFTIGLQPTHGTLSAITQTGPTTAVVTYTPNTGEGEGEGEGVDDVFTFRVTDTEGFTAMGVVTINEGVLPGPPTTVIAEDSLFEAPPGRPSIIPLAAVGPPGVALTVSIVPDSGPSVGTLGPLSQPTQMPQRQASVVYVPAPDYLGDDSFRFRVCGVIAGEQVCDEATVSINIEGPEPPPELAPDLTANTVATAAVSVTLGNANYPPPTGPGSSILSPAVVAGSVSDANDDGIGDGQTAAPAVNASIAQPGTSRIQLEFDLANLGELAADVQSATILLRTNRAANDSLATTFHASGSDGDGALSASDFESVGESIPGAVMPVPLNQPAGADGAYSFDVLSELRVALEAGFTHLVIQGRVDEEAEVEGPAGGLHVYTNDPANPPQLRPQLGLGIRGEETLRVYRVTSLPAHGTLTASNGASITTVPYTLPTPAVTYRATSGFTGQDTFSYDVTQDAITDTGIVRVNVAPGGGDGR